MKFKIERVAKTSYVEGKQHRISYYVYVEAEPGSQYKWNWAGSDFTSYNEAEEFCRLYKNVYEAVEIDF